jgi:hypothetical protein
MTTDVYPRENCIAQGYSGLRVSELYMVTQSWTLCVSLDKRTHVIDI